MPRRQWESATRFSVLMTGFDTGIGTGSSTTFGTGTFTHVDAERSERCARWGGVGAAAARCGGDGGEVVEDVVVVGGEVRVPDPEVVAGDVVEGDAT